MKSFVSIAFLAWMAVISIAGHAQSLTIHIVNNRTGRPTAGVPVVIRYNFLEPRRARKGEVLTAKSDRNGQAVFSDLHLDAGGFSVSVWSMSIAPVDMEPDFFPPSAAPPKLQNPTYSALPADITIRIRKRGFGEELHMIFPGP